MSGTRARAGAKMTGRMKMRARGGHDPNAPAEPEYRPPAHDSPLPSTPIADQFAEMFANDPEAIEWRSAEMRAEWAAKR